MDCNYTIPIPPNMTMNIFFIDFELEDQSLCGLVQSSYFKLLYLLHDLLRLQHDLFFPLIC